MGKAKGRGAFIGVFSYDAMSDVGEMVHRLPAPSARLCMHSSGARSVGQCGSRQKAINVLVRPC